MLILGSLGFTATQNRLKISELIENKTGNMLIIPLACMFGTESGEREKNCAVMAGFEKNKIFVFDESKLSELMSVKYEYITVLGGNTFKLLKLVKEYHLDEFIRTQVANGAIYLGFSAGAYLACANIEYVVNFDSNDYIDDGDFKALGITDKYILCHFNYRGNKEIEMCRRYIGTEVELITINDDQFVVL